MITEAESSNKTAYSRRGTVGTLTLHGTVDIFEAEALHRLAVRALEDAKADTVRVEASHLECLDVAAVQILISLCHTLQGMGRAFKVEGLKGGVKGWAERLAALEITA